MEAGMHGDAILELLRTKYERVPEFQSYGSPTERTST